MSFIQKLSDLNIVLPAPIKPLGSYQLVTVLDDVVHVSGLGPIEQGKPVVGVIGENISLEGGQHASRLTMLMILSCLEQSVGLDNIERCIRLTVYVRAAESFTQHPLIANGASDLLQEVFGATKLPVRSAVGVSTLPMGIPVEIESIFQLKRLTA